MSNFIEKDVIIVNAQALDFWRHKLKSGQIGRWIAEKLFGEYSDRMDILRAIDEQLRGVALGNNAFKIPVSTALNKAQQALNESRYIDAAYYCSVINEIAVEVIMEGKDTIDQLKYLGKDYLTRTENDDSVNYFTDEKKEVEAQMLQNLYKRFFGHPLERAYAKEMAARKKSVQKMVAQAGSFVQQMLGMFDQMGMARASGKIDNWVSEFERFTKSQPSYQSLVNNTYNNSIKDLVQVAKQVNKEHELGQTAAFDYLNSIYGQVAQPSKEAPAQPQAAQPKQEQSVPEISDEPVDEAVEEPEEEIDEATQQKVNNLSPEDAAIVVTLMKSIVNSEEGESVQDGNGNSSYVDTDGNVVFETVMDENNDELKIPLNKVMPALQYAGSIGLLGPKPKSTRVVPMGPNSQGPGPKPLEMGPIPGKEPVLAPEKVRKQRTQKVKETVAPAPEVKNPMVIPVEQGVKDRADEVKPEPVKELEVKKEPEKVVEKTEQPKALAPSDQFSREIAFRLKSLKYKFTPEELEIFKKVDDKIKSKIISGLGLGYGWDQTLSNLKEYDDIDVMGIAGESEKRDVKHETKSEPKADIKQEDKKEPEEPKNEVAQPEVEKEQVEKPAVATATHGNAKATVNNEALDIAKKDVAGHPLDESEVVAVVFSPKLINGEDQFEAASAALGEALGKNVVLFSKSDLSSFQSTVKKWRRDGVNFSMIGWDNPNLVKFENAKDVSSEPEESDDDEIEESVNNKMRSASLVDQIVLKLSHQRFFEKLNKTSSKYDAANLMLTYSSEMEDEDPQMSVKLLAKAQELLND